MKKLFFAAVMMMMTTMTASTSYAAMSYECWAYVGSSPDKMVNVAADSSSEAESLAAVKFADLGAKYDYIKCH